MIVFSIVLTLGALAALLISRFWLLKKVQDAGRDGQRPFDYDDKLVNAYLPSKPLEEHEKEL